MEHISITEEMKKEIVEAYLGGEKMKDIIEVYGLRSNDHLYHILKKQGIEKRRPNTSYSRKPICKHCGHKNPNGAVFCNMCGKSLKSEEEIVVDNLLASRGKIMKFIPDGLRVEVDKRILEAVNLLKAKCEIKG